MEQTFDEWFIDLMKVFASHDWPTDFSKEDFRDYYNDDYSPEETFQEELSYAQ